MLSALFGRPSLSDHGSNVLVRPGASRKSMTCSAMVITVISYVLERVHDSSMEEVPPPFRGAMVGPVRDDNDWSKKPYPRQPIMVRYGPQWHAGGQSPIAHGRRGPVCGRMARDQIPLCQSILNVIWFFLEKREANRTRRKTRRRTMLGVVANGPARLDGGTGEHPGPRNLAEIGAECMMRCLHGAFEKATLQ